MDVIAVGVPDKRRGERPVVLYTTLGERALEDGTKQPWTAEEVCKALPATGLANAALPKPADFFQIPEMPINASFKIDLQRTKELALEHLPKE